MVPTSIRPVAPDSPTTDALVFDEQSVTPIRAPRTGGLAEVSTTHA